MGLLNKLFGNNKRAQSSAVDVDTCKDAGELCNLGNIYYKKKQFAEAIEIYKKALQIDSRHAVVFCSMGAAYLESGQLTKAIVILKRATAINPNYDNAWYNLGNAYYKIGKMNKAEESFQRAIILSPGHVFAKRNLELCSSNLDFLDEIQFVDNKNGTVTDTNTGLMWQQGEAGSKTWEEAVTYCRTLQLAGYSDWRLPDIYELESIEDESYFPSTNHLIDKNFFPGAVPLPYWSSTTDNDGSNVFAEKVNFGKIESHNVRFKHNKSMNLHVRAVRDGL